MMEVESWIACKVLGKRCTRSAERVHVVSCAQQRANVREHTGASAEIAADRDECAHVFALGAACRLQAPLGNPGCRVRSVLTTGHLRHVLQSFPIFCEGEYGCGEPRAGDIPR